MDAAFPYGRLHGPEPMADSDSDSVAFTKVRNALALLNAIDRGQLLGALPEDPGDRDRHNTAVVLLDMAKDMLGDADSLLATTVGR